MCFCNFPTSPNCCPHTPQENPASPGMSNKWILCMNLCIVYLCIVYLCIMYCVFVQFVYFLYLCNLCISAIWIFLHFSMLVNHPTISNWSPHYKTSDGNIISWKPCTSRLLLNYTFVIILVTRISKEDTVNCAYSALMHLCYNNWSDEARESGEMWR